jgi:hypothetical protein
VIEKEMIAAAWREAMMAAGEAATLRRVVSGVNTDATVYVKSIRVPIRDSADEMEGQTYATSRRYLVLAADVGTWPLPIKRNDQLIVDGVTLSIEKVDKAARRYSGMQMAYEVEVYGA